MESIPKNSEPEDNSQLNCYLLKSINEIGLSVRLANFLNNRNITLLWELAAMKTDEFPKRIASTLEEILINHDLAFGMEFDSETIDWLEAKSVRPEIRMPNGGLAALIVKNLSKND